MTLEKLLKEIEQFKVSNLSQEDLKKFQDGLYQKLSVVRIRLQGICKYKK